MRRRVIGLTLLGLGAFALAAALAVRLFLAPTLVKLPLDQTASAVAFGEDVTYLDMGALAERTTDAVVRLEVEGRPDSADAGEDVAVWTSGTTITSQEDGELLTAPSTYTVCLDRQGAVAVDCDSDAIDQDTGRDVEGLTLTFPFGTEQRDYDAFNATTGQTFPARFDGEEEIEGTATYRFVQEIPETVVREIPGVPGRLAGAPDEQTVTAEVVYSNTRTLWVEPTSGVIVTSEESPVTELRGPDGTTGATVIAGTFAADQETRAAGAARAADTAGQITLVRSVLPWALVALGVVLLVAGAVLLARARSGGAHRPQQPVGAPPVAVPTP